MASHRHHRHLRRNVDEESLRRAIRAAESATTGRIHVTLSHDFPGSTLAGAQRAFRAMNLDRTADRNGILYFVVPSRHEFAVVGDAGVHAKLGDAFWQQLTTAMRDRLASGGDLTQALTESIEQAGKQLAAYFPR